MGPASLQTLVKWWTEAFLPGFPLTHGMYCCREFELLEALLRQSTLRLVDSISISWHYQIQTWHKILLWEHLFALLQIEYASL